MARATRGALAIGVGVMRPAMSGGVWHGPGAFVGQGQQRIPFRTSEVGTMLLAGKEHHKDACQQQAEENG
jgi:hypothetical protein